jgi:hypothetical protein
VELPLTHAEAVGSGRLARRAILALFGAAIFLGAALVFLVQPMAARMVLPLFGGSQAVWTTSMLFFQAVLLAGYAYAHVSVRVLGPARQPLAHVGVLLLAAATLPIGGYLAAPPADASPSLWLLGVLALSIGAPFFIVTTASPLLQRWLTASGHTAGRDPYFLYAAGNVGSLLALVAYPFAVEPFLTLDQQAQIWSAGFLLFAALSLGCLLPTRRGAAVAATVPQAPAAPAIPFRTRARWIGMAFVPSSLLLGATTHVSTDVASAPLLWILPLATYLLTFVVAFARRPPVSAAVAAKALPPLVVLVLLDLLGALSLPVPLTVLLHVATLFAVGALAHGRLARERPAPERLTEFYLLLSLGGVLGGVLNALVAPRLFDSVLEYPLVLGLALLLRPRRRPESPRSLLLALVPLVVCVAGLAAAGSGGTGTVRIALACGVGSLLLLAGGPLRFAIGYGAVAASLLLTGSALHAERTFFGVLEVTKGEAGEHRLSHGTTLHGIQRRAGTAQGEPLSYYTRSGPIGDVFATYADEASFRRVDVIGLGVGSLAAYGRPGDRFVFHELDEAVARIAADERLFTFLRDSRAQVDVAIGDGRRTIAGVPRGATNLLVVDAFSSDAVPVHLLTREAVALFVERLSPDGLLAFHVSNRHLRLSPVVANIAGALGLEAVERLDEGADTDLLDGRAPSHWIVVSRRLERLRPLTARGGWRPLRPSGDRVWTDDYSNVLGVLDWNGPG